MKYKIEYDPILEKWVVWEIHGSLKIIAYKGTKKRCEKWVSDNGKI